MVSSSPLSNNTPPGNLEQPILRAPPIQSRRAHADGSPKNVSNVSATTLGSIELHEIEVLPILDAPSSQGAYPNKVKPWTPILLLRVSLYGFAAIYVVFITALALLQAFDRKNGGLVTTSQNLHYLWTYGPTFVLTLVAAVWDQVEYRTKQTLPWAKLHQGKSPASETLLIDYISQAQTVTLWKSLKARHFPVVLATIGGLLLKLLIVVSTGLFSLQQGFEVHQASLLAADKFDPSAWNRTSDDPVPAMFAYAVNGLNMSYPPGTTDHYAIPTLRLADSVIGSADRNITTTTKAFLGDLDCERGNLSFFYLPRNLSIHTLGPDIIVQSPSCQVDRTFWPDDNFSVTGGGGENFFFGTNTLVNCSNSSSELDRARMVVAVGSIKLHYGTSKLPLSANNVTVYVCKVHNYFRDANVIIDTAGSVLHMNTSVPSNSSGVYTVPVSSREMAQYFQSSIHVAFTQTKGVWLPMKDVLTDIIRPPSLDNLEDGNVTIGGEQYKVRFGSLFQLYTDVYKPESTDKILDPVSLLPNLRGLYSLVTAQIAKENLMIPTTASSSGTIRTVQQRLRVRGLPLYWMFAILSILFAISVCLDAIVSRGAVSRDPGSIGGLSTILARSRALENILSYKGFASISSLRRSLLGRSCQSTMDPAKVPHRFEINLAASEPAAAAISPQPLWEEDRVEWWHPMSLSPGFKTTVIAFLGTLVLALEVLYQKSAKSNGLAYVDDKSDLRYSWLYLPGATMLTTSILTGMVDSTSKIFLPYHKLRQGPATSRACLYTNENSQMAISSLFNSVSHRHWSIFATTLATIFAFPLTIVSSGLYSTKVVATTKDAIFSVDSTINFATESIPFLTVQKRLDTASLVVAMILERNLSSPLWTYGEFAFPEMSFKTLDGSNNASEITSPLANSSVVVSTPAWNSSLDCEFIPEAKRHITVSNSSTPGSEIDVYVQLTESAECNSSNENLLITNGDDGNVISRDYHGSSGFKYTSPACPYLVFALGELAFSNTSNVGLSVIACRADMTQTQVNATMELPSLRILAVSPGAQQPISLSQPQTGTIAFDTSINVPAFANTGPLLSLVYASTTDAFFSAIFAQNPNLTLSDLTGAANTPRFAAALNKIWKTVYPQLANNVVRTARSSPNATTPTPETLTGILIQHNRSRLLQSAISTRILEGLLSLIALCIAVSFWSMRVREVLPKNPCSIAAAASLVAGSDMLKRIPRGAEWCDDKQLRENGVLEGVLLSMGWWDDARQRGRRRFGVGIGKAEWAR
ncbi:hypothetical protein BU16DRAFT_607587 [Lophium mytilinum]|uniref:Uncharacterized protein n=1 Tax=Lophium mytilinum TaxID=390894 RepID=A0A6A6QXL8_9PEZI|nr:hypothetical protein BU16DRAFT_607587 [Lophium mytilinum]